MGVSSHKIHVICQAAKFVWNRPSEVIEAQISARKLLYQKKAQKLNISQICFRIRVIELLAFSNKQKHVSI